MKLHVRRQLAAKNWRQCGRWRRIIASLALDEDVHCPIRMNRWLFISLRISIVRNFIDCRCAFQVGWNVVPCEKQFRSIFGLKNSFRFFSPQDDRQRLLAVTAANETTLRTLNEFQCFADASNALNELKLIRLRGGKLIKKKDGHLRQNRLVCSAVRVIRPPEHLSLRL